MHFDYFKADFNTPIEEVKRQYHKLLLKNHPDLGGDNDVMAAINREWNWFKSHNYNVHEGKNGTVYTDWRQDAPDDVTRRFSTLIMALLRLEGVGIEVCGSFIWLSGNTYEYRKVLRALGFKWARRKKRWYIAPRGYYRIPGAEWTMDEIREYHGSQRIANGLTMQVPRLQSA